MIPSMKARTPNLFITFVVAIPLAMPACSSLPNAPPTTPDVPEAATTPTSPWSDLLQQTPYPYTTPLPPAHSTILDGTYSKFDPRQSESTPLPEGRVWMPHPKRKGARWAKPLPYPLEGGVWILQLDKGIFHVFHETTGWRTFGSFTVSEDQIQFFNDPHCINAFGTYRWELEASQLLLEVIEDECDGRVLGGGGLRADNFTDLPWRLDSDGTDE